MDYVPSYAPAIAGHVRQPNSVLLEDLSICLLDHRDSGDTIFKAVPDTHRKVRELHVLAPQWYGYQWSEDMFTAVTQLGRVVYGSMFAPKKATLKALLPRRRSNSHSKEVLFMVNLWGLEKTAPLFALNFEERANREPYYALEGPQSALSLLILLNACVRGTISIPINDFLDGSFLSVGAELYVLGRMFCLTELESIGKWIVTREAEMSCSVPEMPLGLCTAIERLYDGPGLKEGPGQELLHCSVQNFSYWNLGQNPHFLDLIERVPDVLEVLCRKSLERDFDPTGAAQALIALSYSKPGRSNGEARGPVLQPCDYEEYENEDTNTDGQACSDTEEENTQDGDVRTEVQSDVEVIEIDDIQEDEDNMSDTSSDTLESGTMVGSEPDYDILDMDEVFREMG